MTPQNPSLQAASLPRKPLRFSARAKFAAGVLSALLVGCAATAETDGEVSSGVTVEVYDEVATGTIDAAPLPEEWPNNGSPNCVNYENEDPTLFTYKYDENTFILRENKCLNFEANFIYVLFGNDKVLVQDTGSIPSGMNRARFSQLFPIRDRVEELIGEWLAAHPNEDGSERTRDSMELLVTHSHSHGDHVQGDYQFRQADGTPFPYTHIAGLRPTEVASFFGITGWPTESVSFDLGGRVLDILPIPGHEASHIAVYDHGSQLLLSGDSLYPGHLFVASWAQYRDSVKRLNAWVHERDEKGELLRPIVYVLGTHIEKLPEPGKFYPYGARIHDPERKLELFASDLEYLARQVDALGPTSPGREIPYANFAVYAR